MPAIKVLLADDEEGTLEIMAKRVSSAGYEAITALDGKKAWEKIESENPDVVVLDLTMPKMDGWEVLRRVREHDTGKKWRPVIIVSALSEMQNVRKGFDLEADHYLAKPCRIEDIIKAIRLMVSLIPMRNH